MRKLTTNAIPKARKRSNPPASRCSRFPPLRGRIKVIVERNKRNQIRLAKIILKRIGYGYGE